MLTNNTITPSS